jgi:hypothetical protein
MVDNYYSGYIAKLFGELVTKGRFLKFLQFFLPDVYLNAKLLKTIGQNCWINSLNPVATRWADTQDM